MKIKKRSFLFGAALVLPAAIVSCISCNAGKKEIARLEYQSSGCFHSVHYQIRITKDGNSTSAKWSSKDTIQERKLTQAQLDSFNVFAKQLTALTEEGGCTTVDSYILTMDHKRIKKVDGGCKWKGFDNLIKTLFN